MLVVTGLHSPIGDTATGLPKDENYTLYQGFIQIYSWGGGGGGEGGGGGVSYRISWEGGAGCRCMQRVHDACVCAPARVLQLLMKFKDKKRQIPK